MEAIVGDPPYYQWLKGKAKSYGVKYQVDHEDLLQGFLLAVVEGSHAKFEHIFFDSIRKEYNRGLTGKTLAGDSFSTEELLSSVREQKKWLTDFEFIEYMADLKSLLNETEFKLIWLFMAGFDKREIFEECKEMTRRELVDFWSRLGIKGLRLWST